MSLNRIALLTTVSLICITASPAAFAASDKLVSIITNSGNEVNTTTLNQAMLGLMHTRDANAQTSGQQQSGAQPPCPKESTAGNEMANPECLANIAPAAGDDGDSGEEQDSDAEGDDSVNDEAPPADDNPPEETPDEETPTEETPDDECQSECGSGGEEEEQPSDEEPGDTTEDNGGDENGDTGDNGDNGGENDGENDGGDEGGEQAVN